MHIDTDWASDEQAALTPSIMIGQSDLRVAPLGIGTWAWGDTRFWQYGQSYDRSDVNNAFWTSLSAGISLLDTAEVYGCGDSERIVGQLAHAAGPGLCIATKFAPLPLRRSGRALRRALEQSIRRLGVKRVDLYQVHWPLPLLHIPQLMDALADAVADGLVRAVGVSNFSARQMRIAHAALARRGIPLASNQVEYSLLARAPEANGVRDACRELGVTLIAYSPLAMGLLTGKYGPGRRPGGIRRFTPRFSAGKLHAVQPVIALLREIGARHGDRGPSQVALNWLISQGALPIPGAKDARQAQENAGALGWALDETEIAALDLATRAWRNPYW